jgi:hypothetical protein
VIIVLEVIIDVSMEKPTKSVSKTSMSKFMGIKPMLAMDGQPFNSAEWIFEPKIDGTRCITNVS